MSDLSKP